MGNRNFLLHPVIATAIGINILVLVAGLAWAGNDTTRLWRLLGEDSWLEWMQFLSFTVLAGLLVFIAIQRWSRQGHFSFDVLVIGGLSVLVGFAALEEVSYFQRVLGFGSPEFFQQNNRQFETNLHNMVIGGVNLHKSILVKIIFLVGITHNIILPVVARYKPVVKDWVESLGLYLPPLSAAIVYLALVALSQGLVDHPRRGEYSEMFGAIHYMATSFAAYMVGVNYGKAPIIENPADNRRVSILFAMMMFFLCFISWLLGATYVPPMDVD